MPHEYLFQTLHEYGIGDTFITGISRVYTDATSSVQINGHHYGSTPIRCDVRQGCPMSVAFYALCLYPFLRLLERNLPGIRVGRRSRPTSVVAYADNVTIFVTSAADFTFIEEASLLFELHLAPD